MIIVPLARERKARIWDKRSIGVEKLPGKNTKTTVVNITRRRTMTKAERIAELLLVISNKSGRIKKLKLECGKQAIQICVLNKRIGELETDKENLRLYASGLENAQNLINVRFRNLQTEMQEVANQLMDLYDKCIETTEPEVFGTILGLHERLEEALK